VQETVECQDKHSAGDTEDHLADQEEETIPSSAMEIVT